MHLIAEHCCLEVIIGIGTIRNLSQKAEPLVNEVSNERVFLNKRSSC